jgi:[lysine-biosynthesis-protein LysW]--L-2-aminoadipate ligase
VPTPRTLLAYTIDSALKACEMIGYPAVIKPVTGSWGRLLAKVNGPEQARTILTQKSDLGSYHHNIYYIQEYIAKPGRDIRAYVVGDRVLAASYRTSEHWITNTARGAVATDCPVTPELESIVLAAARAVGGGILAVDVVESPRGLLVVEANHTMEFRNSITTTGVDIPARIAAHAVALAAAA